MDKATTTAAQSAAEEKIRQLEEENARLREALAQICEHTAAVTHLIDSLSATEEGHAAAPVTNHDVKNLLKKYSRL